MKLDLTRRGFLGGSVLATAAASLLPERARAQDSEGQAPLSCTVNGSVKELSVGPDETAVNVLRERLGLTGTKVSCGHGACGACTVLVDGTPHVTCLLPATALAGRAVTTVEGLGATALHPVQKAFMAHDALQCGYCTPGFVVEASAFHDAWRAEHPGATPTRDDVAKALAGHLCRCGAYNTIFAAVQSACAGEFDGDDVRPERVDARDKVTGKAVYTVDIKLDGQLEGRVFRSPHAHALLRSFDDSGAKALPGVVAVVRFVPDGGRVRFAGQEVAAVAAIDAATGDEALRRLVVEWDVQPAAVGVEAALLEGAPLVYEKQHGRLPSSSESPTIPAGFDKNIRGPTSSSIQGHPGKAERAIEEAPVVVHDVYLTQNQSHTTLEPHASVARWTGDDALEVHVSTQGCSAIREDLAQRFDLREDQVVVMVPFVGGGFGGKAGLQMDTVIAVELARAAAAPVRVALTRTEEMIVGGYRPGTKIDMAVATDEAGAELLGVRSMAWSDGGVSVGNNTGLMLRMIYPNAPKSVKDWDIVSHGPAGKPLRGPGGVQAFFAMEQAVDELARKLGQDPITMRRRWTPSPVRQRLYDWIEQQPAWKDRAAAGAETGRHRRGIGFAAAGWPCFVQTSAQVQLDAGPDGLVLSSAAQDMGNGTRSMLAHALADEMDLNPNDIGVRIGDSRLVHGPMSAGSRTTVSMGPIVHDLAGELKEHLVEVAAHQMGLSGAHVGPEGVVHDGGHVSWTDVLAVAPPRTFVGKRKRDPIGWLSPVSIMETNVIKATSMSVQMAQVEVDTRLGKVRVLETWTGIGAGRIQVDRLARSQVEGAMIQSVGYSLYEERRLDPTTGWILTSGLEDYRLCGMGDAPLMNVTFDEGGFEDVRGGGVGLAELSMLAVAPSVANAVFHATGFRAKSLPIRPDKVVEGLA